MKSNCIKNKLIYFVDKGISFDCSDDKLVIKGNLKALNNEDKLFFKNNKQTILGYIKNKTSAISSIQKLNNQSVTELSFSQQGLWLLNEIEGNSPHYNIPSGFKLSGELNYDALNQALTTVIARHDSLRTFFAEGDNGQPVALIQPPSTFRVDVSDLSALGREDREIYLAEAITKEASTVFDLSCDLMLRAQLIKLTDSEHVLLVTMHHIASDGWSMPILVNEFSVLYSAYMQGQGNPLPALAIQYSDYAYWQRNWLQGEVLDKQLAYWVGQLRDLPIVHNLPLDRSRQSKQRFIGDNYYSQLSESTSKKLNTLCNEMGATLFMGLHAAFSVLLARYSNETDIVVGSPIANRKQAEVANLMGFFVNTLVLRSDLSSNPTFNELLAQSKSMLLDAYTYQQVPFEIITHELQPARNLSHSPLFQVMLVLENNEERILSLPGLTVESIEQAGIVAKYDLTLTVRQSENGLNLGWEYNRDLFEASTIERMAGSFDCLVDSLLNAPDKNVFGADILPTAELQQLTHDFNGPKIAYNGEPCFHLRFEIQAEACPDNIAVIHRDTSLTYRSLNAQANQLAHYLREQGIGVNSLVGIYAHRSANFLLAMLAINKAGGAFVPFDPSNPQERIDYMIKDAKVELLLTDSTLLAGFDQDDDLTMVCLDKLAQEVAGYSQENLVNINSQDDCAYMIYTSGSTGRPKGALVHHGGALNHADAFFDLFGFVDDEKRLQPLNFLQSAASSFDISVWQFLSPVMSGGHTVILDDITDMPLLVKLVQQYQVHFIELVPAVMQLLVSHLSTQSHAIGALSHLRWIIATGEALPVTLANTWLSLNPNIPIMNAYGPTEASDDITQYIIREPIKGDVTSIPIGRALANLSLYVMDSSQQLLPLGVQGEICVSGVGVGPGYWNNPIKTTESFVINPYADVAGHGKRLYKTGDLGRWLPNGELEFIGRIDDQVKIRGFRIELGEIESQLSLCAGVTSSVVLAREYNEGDRSLVAYVVSDTTNNESDFIAHIKTHLHEVLPTYMVPSAFVLLDVFPLTANGKVDKKALPAPDISEQQAQYIAPTTVIEQQLCDIWQQVLGIKQVGITDNFFELGGHSLLVMQVISRAQKLGLSINVRQVFASSMLSELACLLSLAIDSQAAPFQVPENLIPADCQHLTPEMLPLIKLDASDIATIVTQVPGGVSNIKDIYPLAPLQEGILFHHMMNKESDPYVLSSLFRLSGKSAVDDFIESLQFIVDRHDVLRTAVLWESLSRPIQVVYRKAQLPVNWLALGVEQDVEAHMQALCAPENQLMVLTKGPLLRLTICAELQSGRYLVLLQFHHIISDHVGLEIITEELAAYQTGKADTLLQAFPYRAFVAHVLHQRKAHDEEVFFRKMLEGVDTPTTPFNLVDVQGNGSLIVEGRGAISAKVSKKIRITAKALRMTPASIFHAAWALVIASCSGRDDVVFGTVLSGRLQGAMGAESMVGVFINTLPMRIQLKEATALSLVQQTHGLLQELLPYEQSSLALAQRCSDLPGDVPLFSALLNYRHSAPDENAEEIPSDKIEVLGGHERTNYPFTMSVNDFGEGECFGLDMQVDASVSPERIIGYLQTAVAWLVECLVSTPEQEVKKLSILSKQELHQQLVGWNDTQTDYPKDKSIHELFEAQVKSTPDAVAVVFKNEQLTYGELNSKANQLAHYLREDKQVTPDTLVGICVERSLEMVISMMGILKAGGAYMSLDPEHPSARLQYILVDSGVHLLLLESHLFSQLTLPNEIQAIEIDNLLLREQLVLYPVSNLQHQQIPNSLAYVIYTSGSTGQPKGVEVEHRALVNLCSWHQNEYQPGVGSQATQLASACFDASVWETWPYLLAGATLHIIENELRVSIKELITYFKNKKISHCFMPTVLLNSVAEELGQLLLPDLRYILTGGEKLGPIAAEIFAPALLVNHYGPTEVAVVTTSCVVTGFETEQPPIGRPISNIKAYVLDQYQCLVPFGVVGELYIGGSGLARGYLNRPDLTAEKFITVSRQGKADERLYRSGDLVRHLADGQLQFVGRKDDQVKIRGFRIELNEIAQQLLYQAEIASCQVLARDDSEGNQYITAYVIAAHGCELSQQQLIRELDHQLQLVLPDYMVPSAFVIVDHWPLTGNGKIDHKLLPEPDVVVSQGEYQAPNSDTELTLTLIWSQLLPLNSEDISVTDSFFELGGNSLLVIRLISMIKNKIGSTLTVKDIFTYINIRQIAQQIEFNTFLITTQLSVSDKTDIVEIEI